MHSKPVVPSPRCRISQYQKGALQRAQPVSGSDKPQRPVPEFHQAWERCSCAMHCWSSPCLQGADGAWHGPCVDQQHQKYTYLNHT